MTENTEAGGVLRKKPRCAVCGALSDEDCVWPYGLDWTGVRLRGNCRDGLWDHRTPSSVSETSPIQSGTTAQQ
jgi:hypothetical protein